MFGIGIPELIIILVIILIIFGAGKLPEIGAGLGKGIKNFKKAAIEDDKSDDGTSAKIDKFEIPESQTVTKSKTKQENKKDA